MPVDTTISNQLYISRDQTRLQIIEFMQNYLELENVDLTKTSFLSFITNILSTLTSNLMFYETSIYREFFMLSAQLPETVLNLSAFLGYNSKEATPSTVNVLVTIPLTFTDNHITFNIPKGFNFYAGSTTFTTYYSAVVDIFNNSTASIVVQDGTKTYNLPVSIDQSGPSFSFILPVVQYQYSQQQFQIDSDILPYQFITIDVPFSGQLSNLNVQLSNENGSSWTTYTEFNSLYLMSSTDYGFVSRRTSTGCTLYFGNGLIGVQPLAGSTVLATTYITLGEDGDIIPSSITSGDRIYVTSSGGLIELLNYSCTNTSAGTGGQDEESIQDIKANSIANLVSMGRLVSEVDYSNVDVVIPFNPFSTAPIPILKRSDVKCNEIQLYSNLQFNNSIVPTRNEKLEIAPSTTYIPRGTVITDGSNNYLTLFDMTMDYINGAAYYNYVLYDMFLTPSLQTTYNINYSLIEPQNLEVYLDSTSSDAIFKFNYTGSDLTASCVLSLYQTDKSYIMTNNISGKYFEYSFSPYTNFPSGDVIVNFTISSGSTQVATYSCTVTFLKSLNDFMMSNMISDSTSAIVYDIPVVEETYYNSIVKSDFELQVLQYMMSSLSFSDYRMITDFVNVKFTNTSGTLIGMKYNPPTKGSVISITKSSVPFGNLGDRYIVNGTEGGVWANNKNNIAQCTDSTNQTWYFFKPVMDDIILVEDEGLQYIYTGSQWFYPEYQIPLQIVIEVIKSPTYYGSDPDLVNLITSTLVSFYSSSFGSNITVLRSDIITQVRGLTEVYDCNLVEPQSNIFFNFNIDTFSKKQLLEYSPEYVYFTPASITVKILG
jgi:hypothetical protein